MKIAAVYFELFLLTFTFVCCLSAPPTTVRGKTYWYTRNHELIKQRLSHFGLKPEGLVRVKNVILFVGDGMGLTTVTASRIYKKQKLKNADSRLVFDEFPASALIQTDTANSQISESAAAATALFCGVKTNLEILGADATAGVNVCNDIESHTPSIISWAQDQHLKTGFVTTARITHATPAALYAHSQRHMEDDSKSDLACKDIAQQLIDDETGKRLNVIMGGGLRSFVGEDVANGRRRDGRNLTDDWLENHQNGEFVTDRSQMMNIKPETDHVLGIFTTSHMHFNADRNVTLEPSLAEMTSTALHILRRRNSNGFLLVVEAGKIDLAHHYNNAFRALDDTLALDEAIHVAVRSVDLSESLIIVTADHASALVYSGFATPKDYSVLGMDRFVSNVNKKPYQLLTYSSGLGYELYNETSAKSDQKNSYHKATNPSTWASHGGDDVPLYAIGALANVLFGGSVDQSYVPNAIAFAMCLFKYQNRCYTRPLVTKFETSRERAPSSIHLLKQKLLEASLKEKPKEDSLKLDSSDEIISHNFLNISELDLYSTSDLVGNLTDEASGDCKFTSSFTLVLFIIGFKFVVM